VWLRIGKRERERKRERENETFFPLLPKYTWSPEKSELTGSSEK
jgi:hypothetical protein